MTDEPSDLDLKSLWQDQATEYDPMTLADIHQRAKVFETKVRRRNAREYLACALVVVGFAPILLHRESWMMQAGSAAIMLASAFVGWQLHRRTSLRRPPAGDATLVAFHREELIRQRDALSSVGRWYLAPFIPGLALLLMGRWFQAPAPNRAVEADHLVILLAAGVIALAFLVVWLFNQQAADRIQRQIDQL